MAAPTTYWGIPTARYALVAESLQQTAYLEYLAAVELALTASPAASAADHIHSESKAVAGQFVWVSALLVGNVEAVGEQARSVALSAEGIASASAAAEHASASASASIPLRKGPGIA